jgi:hypothetical protein
VRFFISDLAVSVMQPLDLGVFALLFLFLFFCCCLVFGIVSVPVWRLFLHHQHLFFLCNKTGFKQNDISYRRGERQASSKNPSTA